MRNGIMGFNPFDREDNVGTEDDKEKFAYLKEDGIPEKTVVITNYGRVLQRPETKKILKIKRIQCKEGNVRINFVTQDKETIFAVNRLVAKYFITRTEQDEKLKRDKVHWIDWNPKNSKYDNLIYLTNLEVNVLTKLNHLIEGETNNIQIKAKCVCMLLEEGATDDEIFKFTSQYGITEKMIKNIHERKSFTYVSTDYRFK